MEHGGYDLREGRGDEAREGGESGDAEVRVGSASASGMGDMEWTVRVFGVDDVGREGEEQEEDNHRVQFESGHGLVC